MNLPSTARAAVMTAPGRDLEFREYPVAAPQGRQALVRVRNCSICRSDLHTWQGRRTGPMPVILGHEAVGDIAALGSDLGCDSAGQPLSIGDRITWTSHSSCGHCAYCCQYDLPMKCVELHKFGHESCEPPPHLQGGFAEYCVIDGGTSILKLPHNIPYDLAAPLNCAAATIVAGLEAAQLVAGSTVLLQGAGGLGCYAAAFAQLAGARQIIAADISSDRLELIAKFGATHTLNTSCLSEVEFVERVQSWTNGFGVDCALELAGVPSLIPIGLKALRKGGRYIEIGCTFPRAEVTLDMSTILWNALTMQGIHNYKLAHLQKAVALVSKSIDQIPYAQLITKVMPFSQINAALQFAETQAKGRVVLDMGQ